MNITISQLDASAARLGIEDLIDILQQSVFAGASIGFVLPFPKSEAKEWWDEIIHDLEANRVVLLAALQENKRIVGTAQLWPATKPNQPHRADVSKVLVHPDFRRLGIASRLMDEVDNQATKLGRKTLVLDTATGSEAEGLYQKCGWIRVGDIPDYAMWPNESLCSTTFYYKLL